MIRVADYIAKFFYEQGVDNVFMLSGGGSIYLDDGVACHGKLGHVSVRNEATAPIMAEAYARFKQNLGVVYVTTGPGGANAVSGLAEAWVDSAPVIIVSGQVQRNQASYNTKQYKIRNFGIQEINIVEIVKSITKYAEMVNDPNSIRYHLEKAVYLALSGRPGPVWLDIPLDVQCAMIDENDLTGYEPETTEFNSINIDEDISAIISLLKNAKKPLIIGGGGIRNAGMIDEFKLFIEKYRLPVIFSRLGQDILPFSHECNCGHGGIKGTRSSLMIMQESDFVLSLGSRLAVPFVGTKLDAFSKNAKIAMPSPCV